MRLTEPLSWTGRAHKIEVRLTAEFVNSTICALDGSNPKIGPASWSGIDKHVARLRSAIEQQASKVAASPGTNAAAAQSVRVELERLGDLHARGVLSDEEFTAAKRRLLGMQ